MGWGRRWYVYSAGMRADFYVRQFAGCVELNRDNLLHMDCRSSAERGMCFDPTPDCNLAELRDALVEKRHHE